MKILISGYGNIGKQLALELYKITPDIYDPNAENESYRAKSQSIYDITFVCVPTEMNADGSADISIVEQVIKETLSGIFVIKSAIPVGTAEMLEEKYGTNIVVSPEFYGTTIHAPKQLDWVILGGDSIACSKVANLYYKLKSSNFRVKFTNKRTAELTKYMENCFLAAKVTFCSEFADIANAYGINYAELRECIVMDERIGDSHTFVYPDKPYYDSHCLNKDVEALINMCERASVSVPLMWSVKAAKEVKKKRNGDTGANENI